MTDLFLLQHDTDTKGRIEKMRLNSKQMQYWNQKEKPVNESEVYRRKQIFTWFQLTKHHPALSKQINGLDRQAIEIVINNYPTGVPYAPNQDTVDKVRFFFVTDLASKLREMIRTYVEQKVNWTQLDFFLKTWSCKVPVTLQELRNAECKTGSDDGDPVKYKLYDEIKALNGQIHP